MQMLVNIDVADLNEAIFFYCHSFDLRVGRRFGNTGAELLGSSAPIYLLQKESGSRAVETPQQLRSYRRHWTPVHLDFVVGDMDATLERVLASGGQLEHPVSVNDWRKLACLSDPFGHGICLIQFIGEGYDAIATKA
ncbi:VOC family protein [Bowmanella dokdonensis]|uniref:VOC family protein n=1 Tax=Bowmanella dokdonensis TaxID=751969 RepID=A0A939DJI2_9ALTE|nr:VOC family protein [Bowmanella dokdonensis]MBN7823628.1 VOC family protein [Bowmanella dokdonensis]